MQMSCGCKIAFIKISQAKLGSGGVFAEIFNLGIAGKHLGFDQHSSCELFGISDAVCVNALFVQSQGDELTEVVFTKLGHISGLVGQTRQSGCYIALCSGQRLGE
ncbi:hypothetical protein D3C75_840730 [compost metagenome]